MEGLEDETHNAKVTKLQNQIDKMKEMIMQQKRPTKDVIIDVREEPKIRRQPAGFTFRKRELSPTKKRE